jgi:hypothetical protein
VLIVMLRIGGDSRSLGPAESKVGRIFATKADFDSDAQQQIDPTLSRGGGNEFIL